MHKNRLVTSPFLVTIRLFAYKFVGIASGPSSG